MASYDGGWFRIEPRRKEEVVYWERDRGFVFDAAWGVKPPVVYVPYDEIWDRVVPEWLRGRRAEVVNRLREYSGHVVEDDDYEAGRRELRPIATFAEARRRAAAFLEHGFLTGKYVLVESGAREDEDGWAFAAEPATSDDPSTLPRIELVVLRATGEVRISPAG